MNEDFCMSRARPRARIRRLLWNTESNTIRLVLRQQAERQGAAQGLVIRLLLGKMTTLTSSCWGKKNLWARCRRLTCRTDHSVITLAGSWVPYKVITAMRKDTWKHPWKLTVRATYSFEQKEGWCQQQWSADNKNLGKNEKLFQDNL